MAYRRRARVAERFPGLGVDRLSATDIRVYDNLIRAMDAESVLANPSASPEAIGQATMVLTGNRLKSELAKAKAMLADAIRRKGF